MLARSCKYIYPVLTLTLVTLLVSFQLYKALYTLPYFDDSYYAVVAKNIALGNGYAGVFYDRLIPFERGITSGPVVLLPAALAILLLGNTYWAPGLSCVLLITLLLTFAFRALKRIAPATAWQSAALFLLCVMLLTNHEVGGGTNQNMRIWHALLGEIPSALLVVIATLHIAGKRQNPRTVLTGGMLVGLGALCKLLALIGGGALGLYLAAGYFLATDRTQIPRRRAFINLLLYGTGIALPLLAFETVKLAILGPQSYLTMTKGVLTFIHAYNDSHIGAPLVWGKIYVLGQYLGVFPPAFALPTLVQKFFISLVIIALPAGLIYGFSKVKNTFMSLSPGAWAGGALLWCAFIHMLWVLPITSIFLSRYVTQGIFYGSAGLALLIGELTVRNALKGNSAFICLVLMLFYARADAVMYFRKGATPDENITETEQVLHTLKELQQREHMRIFSCGYAYAMEYLMPESANFLPCETMFGPARTGHKAILFSYNWNAHDEQVVYSPPGAIVMTSRYNPENVRHICPSSDIYSGQHYFIASCH